MNLPKISNCFLSKGGPCVRMALMASSRLSSPTSPTPPCYLESILRRGGDLLRHDETNTDDVEALRAELYKTKTTLLATYTELILSVGSSYCSNYTCHPSCVNPDVGDTQREKNSQTDALLSSISAASPAKTSTAKPLPTRDEERNEIDTKFQHELDGVKRLMAAAHNGDLLAQKAVRFLKRNAQDTPKSLRTPAQNILFYWAKPRPRSLYVDASGIGIGVVLDERWLAWKFAPTHSNLPMAPNGVVDTLWAELTAVEMGVRTLVAGKYGYLPIIVHSDCLGVVELLKGGENRKKTKLDPILQEISALCDRVGLELRPEWVARKENLADEPSKGKYPSRELIIRHCPEIPEHLSELIQEVDSDSE